MGNTQKRNTQQRNSRDNKQQIGLEKDGIRKMIRCGLFEIPSNEFIMAKVKKNNINIHQGCIVAKTPEKNCINKASQVFSIHQWKATREIALRLEKCTKNDAYELVQSLRKYPKQIQKLKLSLEGQSQTIDDELEILCPSITRSFTCLQEFDISISLCSNLTSKGINVLVSEISRYLTQLRSMRLNFYDCENLIDDELDTIASETSKNLVHLKHLDLGFSRSINLTDNGIEAFGQYISRYPKHLQSLKLRFETCKEVTDKGVEFLGSKIMKHLIHLNNLSIRFPDCCKITDDSVQELSSKLAKTLSKLRCLKLDFYNCNVITDKTLITIGSNLTIPSLSQLQSLDLRLGGGNNKITDHSLAILGNQISQNLKMLRTLNLSFSLCMTNKGMKAFGQSLSRNLLTQLQHLKLKFRDSSNISTDQHVEAFIRDIASHLTQLQSLTLHLDCAHLKNNGVGTIGIAIARNLTRLQKLDLSFFCCDSIGDLGLHVLGSEITTHLTQIQSLTLDFMGCDGISGMGVEEFVVKLARKLVNLRTLNLEFDGYSMVDSEIAIVLKEMIKTNLKYLQESTLYI